MYHTNLQLVCYYVYAVFIEWVEYWYIYLLLTLPAYLFAGNNSIKLSDKDNTIIWFNHIKLVLQTDTNSFSTEELAGAQLMSLADDGYITFNKLNQYYPTLDTLYLKYLKIDDDSNEEITKVIDIAKKLDLRSIEKCKFGRITL